MFSWCTTWNLEQPLFCLGIGVCLECGVVEGKGHSLSPSRTSQKSDSATTQPNPERRVTVILTVSEGFGKPSRWTDGTGNMNVHQPLPCHPIATSGADTLRNLLYVQARQLIFTRGSGGCPSQWMRLLVPRLAPIYRYFRRSCCPRLWRPRLSRCHPPR